MCPVRGCIKISEDGGTKHGQTQERAACTATAAPVSSERVRCFVCSAISPSAGIAAQGPASIRDGGPSFR